MTDNGPYVFARQPLLVVISGPAAAGKDALIQRMQELNGRFHFVVTATDRAPRPGEVDGVDYYFVSTAEFNRMIQDDELIEHAIVYGQHKGVPKQHVREALASGLDVLMRLDVQGAEAVRQLIPQAVLIFLTPGSEAELVQRLHERGHDTPEQIERRLATAREEMERVAEFDYVVVNEDGKLDRAVEDVFAIIRAEHRRVKPRAVIL